MQPRPPLPLHRLHDEEIERLLASGERAAELAAWFGARGYRELATLARQAAGARTRGGPVTYVLPGLMGSRIGTRGRLLDDVLWLDPFEIAAGHLTRLALPRGSSLAALGVMLLNALKLKFSLQIAGFDARFHAYDWRLGLGTLAVELNARIAAEGATAPMVVGHSMGGVVARLALGVDGGRIARVVQLGAPNAGSFAPVLALRAVYPTVRKLAALDLRHDAEDLARLVFRTLPSLHELLPDATRIGGPDLFAADEWPDDALRPDPQALASARAARRDWARPDERCLHVIGVRQETVTGVERRGGEFQYTFTTDGDGTVPRSLADVGDGRSWFVAEKHGGLPNNGRVISAVAELLRTGSTDRLAAAQRSRPRLLRRVSESTLRRVAPHKLRWQDLSPDARRRLLEPVVSPEFHGRVDRAALRATPKTRPSTGAGRTVEIRLSPRSIVDASARALVLGVFRNVDPSGAAAAVDARLGGAIRERTLRRMLPAGLGDLTMLPGSRGSMLAEFVLLAGLGDVDEFGSDAQAYVAAGVVRTLAQIEVQDFATVLFGTGSGIPAAAALEQQLGGFLDGLRRADRDGVVRRITICEIDPRRVSALRRTLPKIAARLAGEDLRLVVDEAEGAVDADAVRRRRATAFGDPAYLTVTFGSPARGDYECRSVLLTAGAQAAVLSGTVTVPRNELRALLAPAGAGTPTQREVSKLGERIARRLLPTTVREGLAAMSRRSLVVVHDREASRVPWETLFVGDAHPALGRGLSRRYASDGLGVARLREARGPGERLRVLMAVNPTLDLPGAAREGEALRDTLSAHGAVVECLEGAAATRDRLLDSIRDGKHDVLHFAGHAFFEAGDPDRSGVVCAGGEVLAGADLAGLGELPSLVFINACEAARVRRRERPTGRPPTARLFGLRRSGSLAEAFLDGGVANFLGTHWPVGDEAAMAFSRCLYETLLGGATLGAAVLAARQRVCALGSIDWADYVHYGNPDFLSAPPDAQT